MRCSTSARLLERVYRPILGTSDNNEDGTRLNFVSRKKRNKNYYIYGNLVSSLRMLLMERIQKTLSQRVAMGMQVFTYLETPQLLTLLGI